MTRAKKNLIIVLAALAVLAILIFAAVFILFGSGFKSIDNMTGDKGNIKVEDMKSVPDFKVKDVNGKTVTQAVFSKNRLTLVNVWGTYCSSCLKEMPDIEKVYQEYSSKNVGVIGIAEDGQSQEPQVNEILKKAKVTYENLIPDDKFTKDFVSHESGIPYTFMVNKKGRIVDFTIGAHSKKTYENMINKNM
jgi:thiol-disulfide isomerase/thioredoxin